MGTKVVVVGGGAVGGFIASQMARAGEDVTLIDTWPTNVGCVRAHGMRIVEVASGETAFIPLNAMHVSDVQSLSKQRAVDVAFVAMKSYDTEWATRLIAPYLAPSGFVVSTQNCINEETIASVVGWGKTLGVIISNIGVDLYEPGSIKRTGPPGGEAHTVFRAGEVHGRITPRAAEVARLLSCAETATITTNLWGERWSKLVINAMANALPAITEMNNNERDTNEVTRSISIRLASEAVRVGQALGYRLEEMVHMQPETLALAGEGNQNALAEITRILLDNTRGRSDDQRSSTGQDILKGRRTEIDNINGYVVAKGEAIGLPTPINAKINELVKRIERGELKPGLDLVKDV